MLGARELKPVEVFEFLHRDPSSEIFFMRKKSNDDGLCVVGSLPLHAVRHQWSDGLSEQLRENSYFTINGARPHAPDRKTESMKFLTALKADFDWHHPDRVLTADEMLLLMFDSIHKVGMPRPSLFTISGRGVWALWRIASDDRGQPADIQHADVYYRLNGSLLKALAAHVPDGCDVDQKVKDIPRVMRVPQSINTKAGDAPVQFFHLSDDMHTLPEFATVLCVRPKDAHGKTVIPARQWLKCVQQRWAVPLNWLIDVVTDRWINPIPQGTRHLTMRAAAYLMIRNHWDEDAMTAMLTTFADIYCVPKFTRDEIEAEIKQARGLVHKRWNLRHETLCQWIHATLAERALLIRPKRSTREQYRAAVREGMERRRRLVAAEMETNPNVSVREMRELLRMSYGIEVSVMTVGADMKAASARRMRTVPTPEGRSQSGFAPSYRSLGAVAAC